MDTNHQQFKAKYSNAAKSAKRKITRSQASNIHIQKFPKHTADYN